MVITDKNAWEVPEPKPKPGVSKVQHRIQALKQQFGHARLMVLNAEANLREAQDACAHLMGQIQALEGLCAPESLAQSLPNGDNKEGAEAK